MYKRKANAPFKAPRRLSASSLKEEIKPALFVSDSVALQDGATDSHGAKAAHPNASVKRLKVGLPQQVPFKPPAHSAQDHPEKQSKDSSGLTRYYLVQWRKRTKKKNKSWEGDGYISVTDSGTVLKTQLPDQSFKYAARSTQTSIEGVVSIGVYEVEVDSETTKELLEAAAQTGRATSLSPRKSPSFNTKLPVIRRDPELPSSPTILHPEDEAVDTKEDVAELALNLESEPQFEPLVLLPPTFPGSRPVEVDPRLVAVLRPHQREGVSFIYECLLGIRNNAHYGALLADEMGLGKSLMTIAVIWTLLKQSPFADEKVNVKKVLICCPVTLIDNWRREFGKWLDVNRIGVLALNNKKQSAAKDKEAVRNFAKTNVYQVLILNYEKVISCSKELADVNIDLLVCDEGHRLKNSANKMLKVLSSLAIKKRLVVTGTPIQNDLNEYFNIVNFINPGILGTVQDFQRDFLKPISRAREANCFNAEIIAEGKHKSALLIELTKGFTIRRTKSAIESYLPAKTDLLVFCSPVKLQKSLIEYVNGCSYLDSALKSGTRDVLALINLFRKICNSPSLLHQDTYYKTLVQNSGSCPADLEPKSLAHRHVGGKISILVPLLLEFSSAGEKSVLVSNYTQTLDLLEVILKKLNISYARLDGSTPASSRDALVTSFNKSNKHKVFLLSSKAGGVGLNLVGASRLVLFDNDWNPLVDIQAMARIHRDGQKKPVFIYRLFTTGCIDEKIFQRQLVKGSLSDMFLDDQADSVLDIFDYEDLRNLFALIDTNCNTHDLLECNCRGTGQEAEIAETQGCPEIKEGATKKATTSPFSSMSSGYMSALELREANETEAATKRQIRSALSCYKHYDPKNFSSTTDTGDSLMNSLIMKTGDDISYIFAHTS